MKEITNNLWLNNAITKDIPINVAHEIWLPSQIEKVTTFPIL